MNLPPFKIVSSNEKDPNKLDPGEAIVFQRNNPSGVFESYGLMLSCPECGHAGTGPHKFDPSTNTLKPSIRCNQCKWHGFLTNGLFHFKDYL